MRLFFFLFFSFLIFPHFVVARPLNLKKGGFYDSTKKREELKIEQSLPPPTPPPRPEYEIVATEGSIFPSTVTAEYPWPSGVYITLKIKEMSSGVFIPLPQGTEISFKIFRSHDGGATWDEECEGDEIVFPPNNPYIVPSETTAVTFMGQQIVLKVGNEGIEDLYSYYCLGVKIKI
jgi:hypothetical protein